MEPIAFFVLLFFVCIVAFIVLFNSYLSDRRIRKASSNFNLTTGCFYYLLEVNKEKSLDKISFRNISDMDDYLYDAEKSMVILENRGASYNLFLSFYTIQGYDYMVVNCKTCFDAHNGLPVVFNKFFAKKMDATPVEASYFEALLKNNQSEIV